MSCYEQCKTYGYPDCDDMETSCQASGGSGLKIVDCLGDTYALDGHYFGLLSAEVICHGQ